MCLNKKVIPNPVRFDHLSGFDKPFIKVACCKCPECRSQRANDWIFRSYWELMYEKNPTFFVTLTYSDEYLPYFNGKPCFNRDHTKNFLKRLRHKLGSFRYLIVPEYGGLFRRSHYHMLLSGLKKDFNELDVYWAIRDTWYYGEMIDIGKMQSVQHSFLKAVTYVTEYVTKDPFFDVFEYEKDFDSKYDSRIQVSSGYGAKFFDFLTKDILLQGFYYLPIGKNGTDRKFQIPRYYELRKCYDYSYDPKTRTVDLKKNLLGVELALERHNRRYDYLSERIKSLNITSLEPVRNRIEDLCHRYGYPSYDALVKDVHSSSGFKYYLYHRDFITSYSEHINSSLKYDEVFKDFYRSGSVLDDTTNGYYFFNHLSGKEEFGDRYKLYKEYLDILDSYDMILDDSSRIVKEQKATNRVMRKMYNKLRSRPDLLARYKKYRPSFDIELINSQYSFKFN